MFATWPGATSGAMSERDFAFGGIEFELIFFVFQIERFLGFVDFGFAIFGHDLGACREFDVSFVP